MSQTTSPGWAAIDGVLDQLYDSIEPHHVGTVVRWSQGGPDPLDGVSCYESSSFGVPHWHFVTYGLTELYAKRSSEPTTSGWGVELTMRLRRGPERVPPMWPINLLQNMARYTFETGRVLKAGDVFDVHGPIASERNTALTALFFVDDPELPNTIETAHGAFRFVQLVGVTQEELDAADAWSQPGIAALVGPITDLYRAGVLDGPGVRARVEAATAREGSSTELLQVDQLGLRMEGETFVLFLGASVAERVGRLVCGRLAHGRHLVLRVNQTVLELAPGPRTGFEGGVLRVPPEAIEAFSTLRPRRGVYPIAPELRVEVLPTSLLSADGSRVEGEIG